MFLKLLLGEIKKYNKITLGVVVKESLDLQHLYFFGINILTMANFKLPAQHHLKQSWDEMSPSATLVPATTSFIVLSS